MTYRGRVAPAVSRSCLWCGSGIPNWKRQGTKYCCASCRSSGKSKAFREKNPEYHVAWKDKSRFRGKESDKAKRRRYWLNLYKTKSGCALCGYNKFGPSLHFDHKDPETKLREVSSLIMSSVSVLMTEVRKCRVLCANCHMEVTHGI